MTNNKIIEGSPEWEKICEQCGMCCLLKYRDSCGNVYLTRVRCAALDKDTRKCRCYAPEMQNRDNGHDNCIALGGERVTRLTLNDAYAVPSFCPYAQRFCTNPKVKKAKHRPEFDWENTISETELKVGDSLANYVVPNSNKYFKYNPHVNQRIHDEMKIQTR